MYKCYIYMYMYVYEYHYQYCLLINATNTRNFLVEPVGTIILVLALPQITPRFGYSNITPVCLFRLLGQGF